MNCQYFDWLMVLTFGLFTCQLSFRPTEQNGQRKSVLRGCVFSFVFISWTSLYITLQDHGVKGYIQLF